MKKTQENQGFVPMEPETPVNRYYLRVAGGYRAAKLVSLAVLIVFVFVMLASFRSSLTYENLVYLMKDLDFGESDDRGTFTGIQSNGALSTSVTVFRSDLAVAGADGVRLYSPNGKLLYSYALTYGNPMLISGEKYLMAYSPGGRSYSLYTNIARVKNAESADAIVGADLGDDGSYALITKSTESKFLVTFYDRELRESVRILKDKYVIDCSISPDGSHMALISLELDSPELEAELVICSLKEGVAEATVILDGFFPLELEWQDGGIVAVGSEKTVFFSEKGEWVSEAVYSPRRLERADFFSGGLMLVFRENTLMEEYSAVLFDMNGKELYNNRISEPIRSAAVSEDGMRIYVATRDGILMIPRDGERQNAAYPEGYGDLVPYGSFVLVWGEGGILPVFNY